MRDPKTEQYLSKGGYAYQFVEGYDLGRIDLHKESQNPARLVREKDQDRITKMFCAMVEGTNFPAIVVFAAEGPLDDLVTGYHRGCAYREAEISKCDAYVIVEHDPYRRALLPRAINSIEGKSSTQSEDLQQIVELLRLFPNATQADLAHAFSIKAPQIADYLKLIEGQDRAKTLGVDGAWSRITSVMSRRALCKILNDHVFVMAVEAIDQMKLVGRPADDLIEAARRAKTEAAAAKILQDALRRYIEMQEKAKAKYGKAGRQTMGTRWFSALRRLWRVIPTWDLKKLHLDGYDAQAIATNLLQLKEVRQQIDEVIADQERRLQQHEQEQAWRKAGAPHSGDTSPNGKDKR